VGELISFESSNCPVVTEPDLWNIVSSLDKIASTQARIDLIANSVVERLKAGAEIEEACRYTAKLEAIEIGGIREERLMIDGVCRWRRIAGSAAALRRHAGVLGTDPL
jgi:hypothetical protein